VSLGEARNELGTDAGGFAGRYRDRRVRRHVRAEAR
jgi:hypothetical protein